MLPAPHFKKHFYPLWNQRSIVCFARLQRLVWAVKFSLSTGAPVFIRSRETQSSHWPGVNMNKLCRVAMEGERNWTYSRELTYSLNHLYIMWSSPDRLYVGVSAGPSVAGTEQIKKARKPSAEARRPDNSRSSSDEPDCKLFSGMCSAKETV